MRTLMLDNLIIMAHSDNESELSEAATMLTTLQDYGQRPFRKALLGHWNISLDHWLDWSSKQFSGQSNMDRP